MPRDYWLAAHMNSKYKLWYLGALLVITHGLFLVGGYQYALTRSKAETGEHALSNFMDGLAVLSYLEKGNLDGARSILRSSLDGDLISMFRYGTPSFDAHYAASGRDPKSKMLAEYGEIRNKYPPIEYGDGGWMNQHVEDILKSAPDSAFRK
jgi:hypothetical protein